MNVMHPAGLLLLLAILTCSASLNGADFASHSYPDFSFLPPPSKYPGRVFQLSQRYPLKLPDEREKPKFMDIDFKTKWREYLIEARTYCFKGNTDGDDVESHFDVAKVDPPHWFHMPWQHYGPKGREGAHGLTKEARALPKLLAPTQLTKGFIRLRRTWFHAIDTVLAGRTPDRAVRSVGAAWF